MNLKTKLVCGWTNLNEEGKMQERLSQILKAVKENASKALDGNLEK